MNTMNVKKISICGLSIAIIFLCTSMIAVPIGQFGYVNIGDGAVLFFSSLLSPFLSFFVGGVGSALADLYLGFTHYALFTLIIKGLEGMIVSYIFHHVNHKMKYFGYVLGIICMIFGYYLSDALLYNDFIVALGGLSFNSIQGFISLILVLLLQPLVNRLDSFLD